MSRSLKFALCIGLLASLAVVMASQLGVFDSLDFALSTRLEIGVALKALPLEAERILLLVLGVGMAYVTIDVTRWSLRFLLVGILALELVFSSWLFGYFDRYFSPFAPLTVLAFAFLGASLYAVSNLGQRKRKAIQLLDARLAPSGIHEVIESDVPLPFEPRIDEASVLILEVFNHEDLIDQMSTKTYIEVLNRVLDTTAAHLLSEGAYLDQCDGEGVRAVFGLPLDDPNHAARACQAGLELSRRLENLNLEIETEHHVQVDARMAVHSGEYIVAIYSGDRVQRLGVGGEPVDFARTLCQVNSRYGTRLLIGGRTLEMATNMAEARPVDLLSARDTGLPVEIYELIGTKASISAVEIARRDLFWDGVVLFREGLLDEASEAFEKAKPVGRPDPLVEFYLQRIRRESKAKHQKSVASSSLRDG